MDNNSTSLETNDILDPNKESESKSSEVNDFTDNIKYEGTKAVYTDPTNGTVYDWNESENKWEQRTTTYIAEDGCYHYVDNEGMKFFWDTEKKAWFPKVDDDFMAMYQMNYGTNNSDAASVEPPKKVAPKKSSIEDDKPKNVDDLKKIDAKRTKVEPTWFDVDESQNTSVYVSNLPLDTTEEEFVELMQKCGLIMRDSESQQFKIKLYKDSQTNELKGDALCKYIKVESVELALNILDGIDFKNQKIKVEKAKFQMKGEYNPKLKPKAKKKRDKIKLKRNQEKLFDWRPEKVVGEKSKSERVVTIKNLFEPKMFDDDVGLILEIKEDLREECSKLGTVKKITIYDRHPEGVAQIVMSTFEEAESVVELLNGRWFMKRQLMCEIWDGKTKYKVEETDSEISTRLNNWDSFLEQEEEKQEK